MALEPEVDSVAAGRDAFGASSSAVHGLLWVLDASETSTRGSRPRVACETCYGGLTPGRLLLAAVVISPSPVPDAGRRPLNGAAPKTVDERLPQETDIRACIMHDDR